MPKSYRVFKLDVDTNKEEVEVILEQEKPFVQYGSALTTVGYSEAVMTGGFPKIDLDLNLREAQELLDKSGFGQSRCTQRF